MRGCTSDVVALCIPQVHDPDCEYVRSSGKSRPRVLTRLCCNCQCMLILCRATVWFSLCTRAPRLWCKTHRLCMSGQPFNPTWDSESGRNECAAAVGTQDSACVVVLNSGRGNTAASKGSWPLTLRMAARVHMREARGRGTLQSAHLETQGTWSGWTHRGLAERSCACVRSRKTRRGV